MVAWPRWPPCLYIIKKWKILLLRNRKADDPESWYAALDVWVLPRLFKLLWVDLDLFNVWEDGKQWIFSETIVVYDIKFGRCSQLNEYMKLLVSKVKVIHWPWSKSLKLNIFKLIFLNNHKADWSQISCEASLWWTNETLFKWSRSHDQDGRHAHIW